MRLPGVPKEGRFARLTPTLYEAAIVCRARARWSAFGDRTALPQHPQAILGSALHAVMEAVHKGHLRNSEAKAGARKYFDAAARALYERAHPLVRNKFGTQERIPFYNLFRERAALLALDTAGSKRGAADAVGKPSEAAGQKPGAEKWLQTPDGSLAGRSDYIDVDAGEVVDYKTGAAPEQSEGVHESEARQLRFYAHLAWSSGIKVMQGVIVRSDGGRSAIRFSEKEVAAEGQRARQMLADLNSEADKPFGEVATPSPRGCRHCACVPFCEAFWIKASPDWVADSGLHLEGRVRQMSRAITQNVPLLSLDLLVERGTAPAGPAVIEQLPESWATADGSPAPEVGDLLRITHGRVSDMHGQGLVVRADRIASTVWSVTEKHRADG